MPVYEEGKDVYRFRSGKEIYANCGILGLGPDNDRTCVMGGYDGTESCHLLTTDERQELAKMMVARWEEWGEL